jgi:hypothetical protein
MTHFFRPRRGRTFVKIKLIPQTFDLSEVGNVSQIIDLPTFDLSEVIGAKNPG